MEGFMYRCHPQIERLVELIGNGEIGKVQHIEASFGFASNYNPDSRLDNLLWLGERFSTWVSIQSPC